MARTVRPPALEPAAVRAREGKSSPAPFEELCRARRKHALGDALGLGNFGVNLVSLPPRRPGLHRQEGGAVLRPGIMLAMRSARS